MQIDGQYTDQAGGLAWLPQPDSGDLDGCLVLVYKALDSRKAVTTRSWDGLTWTGTPQNELVPTPDDGYVPALVFHTASNKLIMVYQADNKLHVTFSNDGLAWETPATPVSPTAVIHPARCLPQNRQCTQHRLPDQAVCM